MSSKTHDVLQGTQVANPWHPMTVPGLPTSPMKESPVAAAGDVSNNGSNTTGLGADHVGGAMLPSAAGGASRMVPAGPGRLAMAPVTEAGAAAVATVMGNSVDQLDPSPDVSGDLLQVCVI
eukprot:gene6017-6255_t